MTTVSYKDEIRATMRGQTKEDLARKVVGLRADLVDEQSRHQVTREANEITFKQHQEANETLLKDLRAALDRMIADRDKLQSELGQLEFELRTVFGPGAAEKVKIAAKRLNDLTQAKLAEEENARADGFIAELLKPATGPATAKPAKPARTKNTKKK